MLDNIYRKKWDDLTTASMRCVLYDRTGNNHLAMEESRKAYQKMIVGVDYVDSDIVAQVYHNYACFLIKDHQINRGLDIAKDAVDYVLKEGKSALLHPTMEDYLKLLVQYTSEDFKIQEYMEKYEKAIVGDCNICLSYVNMKLYLLNMNRQKENVGNYLLKIYKVNMMRLVGEQKCFFILSCMNVAFAHGIDIKNFFHDILGVMKDECKKLETVKRVRFYNGLSVIYDFYLVQCERNNFNISEHYNEFVHLYIEYRKKLE